MNGIIQIALRYLGEIGPSKARGARKGNINHGNPWRRFGRRRRIVRPRQCRQRGMGRSRSDCSLIQSQYSNLLDGMVTNFTLSRLCKSNKYAFEGKSGSIRSNGACGVGGRES